MIDSSELPTSIPSLKLKCVAIDTYKENVAYLHRNCGLYRSEGFQALSKIEIHTANSTQPVIAVLNVVDDASITDFEFYPITALMIILLALLNDLPILTIAYDNTYQSPTPVRWNMHELFIISSALGLAGVCASFLLYLFLREQNLDNDTIQTLIFLKLLIAGHSTIFVTRNNGWFWQKPWPSPLLLAATLGTEIIGTLMAVNGIFITAVSWQYAGFMWLYALVWFVIDNAIKIGIQHSLFNQPPTKTKLPA